MNELVLGTANLRNEYGRNVTKFINLKGSFKILDAAWERGIRWLDVAANYNNLQVIQWWHRENSPRRFSLIMKAADRSHMLLFDDMISADRYVLAHGRKAWTTCRLDREAMHPCVGASLYNKVEYEKSMRVIEVPINIYDMKWCTFNPANKPFIIARSVFLQGELWKHPTYDLAAASLKLASTFADMVIVGVNDVNQLDDIYRLMDRNAMQVDYHALAQGDKEWLK